MDQNGVRNFNVPVTAKTICKINWIPNKNLTYKINDIYLDHDIDSVSNSNSKHTSACILHKFKFYTRVHVQKIQRNFKRNCF